MTKFELQGQSLGNRFTDTLEETNIDEKSREVPIPFGTSWGRQKSDKNFFFSWKYSKIFFFFHVKKKLSKSFLVS